MMLAKIHRSYRDVVAICDKELIGKKFEEGKKQLEVSENFFGGEEMTKEEIIKLIERQVKEDASFNIAGKESVATAIEMGLANEKSVGYVQEIPIILVF